jgi:two-component system, cell cycle sensor histidine kinase and response regulator CckA
MGVGHTSFGTLISNQVSIERKFNADCVVIEGDRSQINQLMLNMAINSRDAMSLEQPGTITFQTENVTIQKKFAEKLSIATGLYVKLSVIDTGSGIPESQLHKIFDPFYTTKGETTGTGLGLSTVQNIMKNHHGFVEVKSEVGKGTRFDLHFPCKDKTPKIPDNGYSQDNGNSETVLFADHDSLIDK